MSEQNEWDKLISEEPNLEVFWQYFKGNSTNYI
jgi:hypothetical protein